MTACPPDCPVAQACRQLEQTLSWVRQCLKLRSEGGLRPVRDPQDWKTLLFVIDQDLKKVRKIMFTTGSQVMVHGSGRKMMTWESAKAVAEKFRELGGFSRVEISEFGFDSGCWCVELWSVNPKAGNRNLHTVDQVPMSAKEYALIKKTAIGKATDRDKAAMARIAAEREMNLE